VCESEVDAFLKQVHPLMENAAKLDVPLLVEAQAGDNWEQAH
jgi:DNA polymerase-1